MVDWPNLDWLRPAGPPDASQETWARQQQAARKFFTPNYDYASEPIQGTNLPPFFDMLATAPEWAGKRLTGLGRDYVRPVLSEVWDQLTLPRPQYDEKQKKIQEDLAAKAKADNAVQSPEGGVVKKDATEPSALSQKTGSISLGPAWIPPPPPTIESIEYPMPPDIPPPAAAPTREPFNFQPYLDRMAEFAPADLDRKQYMKERLLANLSRAFAAGAGGSGWSGWGGSLARMGSGFGMAQAETTDQFLEEQMGIDRDQQEFGLNQLDLEMRLAQEADNIAFQNQQVQAQNAENIRQNTIANDAARYNVTTKNIQAAAEANQSNRDRFWEYTNQVGERMQTKVLPGTGKGNIVMQTIDQNTGEQKLNYVNISDSTEGGLFDNNYLNAAQDVAQIFGKSSDQYQQVLYKPVIQSGDVNQFKKLMAQQAFDDGYTDVIIPEDAQEDIAEQAEEIVGKQGIQITDEDEWHDAMRRATSYLMMQYIDLNNQEQIQALAERGNFGARFRLSQ